MATRLGLLLLAVLACIQPVFGEAVINGNFEAGDLTGWDTRDTANNTLCYAWETVQGTVEPPNHYAVLDVGAATEWTYDQILQDWVSTPGWAFASISQSVTVAVGDKVTFNYTFDSEYDNAQMTIWRDTTLLDTIPLSYSEIWIPGSYTFQEAGSLFIEFSTSLSYGSARVQIDDVQLTPAPEPGTFVLLAIGAVVCGMCARFRRKGLSRAER